MSENHLTNDALAAANDALVKERNHALAAVTTAEQRAVSAEAALEAMTQEKDQIQRVLRGDTSALAAALAQARREGMEAAAALIMPKNDPSDWTEYASIRARAAMSIRAAMEGGA